VTVSGASLDAASGTYTLTLKQSCRAAPGPTGQAAQPFHIPVVVGLLDAATGLEVLASTTLQLTEPEATFTLEGVAKGTTAVVPSILRGFSAPVNVGRANP
jgi:aminopeptidase N